ncbi:MAG TPA: sigma 54-interacting transcriptional regulator [Syntrophales bacterium]|nr:sigma 54-interacting transcriptional regulator [Syntrophales bacterium]HPQ43460.1 sigma 54-interacting transcriptional regulator [Syntrophales bacterium]
MDVDEREFFREATLKMCGSLEIEKAMSLCVQYISRFIPIDMLFLNLYEPDLGAMRTIATASVSGGKQLDRLTFLPEDAKAYLNEMRRRHLKEGGLIDALIVNRPQQDPICRTMIEDFGISDSSLLVMPLTLEGDNVGHVIFKVPGKDIYSSEHARLVSLLKEPFAIAMSNAVQHQEVLRLKDLLADDNRYLQDELQRQSGDEIIGADFGLQRVMNLVHHVAPLTSPVLLLGETGTGKEVIASAIHRASPRRENPFIPVNCGAIPETLIDSELFGHEKGAFTGALNRKRGRFERAHGGTIFLDEIGELTPEAQVRLLRVLQEKTFERVGGTESLSVDIRVIAATHRDLPQMIAQGRFREDLYFRLKVFPIEIPPLRERSGDIPALVQHFLLKKSREMKLGSVPALASRALDLLMTYNWPGNVRELENAVERALILSHGKPLVFADFDHAPPPVPDSAPSDTKVPLPLDQAMGEHILRVLTMTGGKVEGSDGAAELLGINPGTLRHRMRKLGIPFGRNVKKYGNKN